MRKWMCLLLAALLFTPALAEEQKNMGGATLLKRDEVYELDLDGDGTKELVSVQMQGAVDEENLELLVETDELVYNYDTYIMSSEAAYAVDLDGDGKLEVLISGDEASADFSTWCLTFDREQGIRPIQFADSNRGDNTDGYFDYGYGRVDAIDGNVLTMTGSQDALGTWWCSRQYTLRDGRFELDDGGVWIVVEDFDDPDNWEYRGLKLLRDLNVTLEDGKESVLKKGDCLLITETDKVSYVGFVTREGVRGTFPIAPDVEAGWGFLVEGTSEYDFFEYVPYAD